MNLAVVGGGGERPRPGFVQALTLVEVIAHCEACCPCCSKTSRTARSRTSCGDLLGRPLAPSSQHSEPPGKSGRFTGSSPGKPVPAPSTTSSGTPSAYPATSPHGYNLLSASPESVEAPRGGEPSEASCGGEPSAASLPASTGAAPSASCDDSSPGSVEPQPPAPSKAIHAAEQRSRDADECCPLTVDSSGRSGRSATHSSQAWLGRARRAGQGTRPPQYLSRESGVRCGRLAHGGAPILLRRQSRAPSSSIQYTARSSTAIARTGASTTSSGAASGKHSSLRHTLSPSDQ